MKNEISLIIKEIIEEQSNIVGLRVALDRARSTKVIDIKGSQIRILSTPEDALKKLIKSFAEIFGEASVEVCDEVIKKHNLFKK
jgi:hypothetical protein